MSAVSVGARVDAKGGSWPTVRLENGLEIKNLRSDVRFSVHVVSFNPENPSVKKSQFVDVATMTVTPAGEVGPEFKAKCAELRDRLGVTHSTGIMWVASVRLDLKRDAVTSRVERVLSSVSWSPPDGVWDYAPATALLNFKHSSRVESRDVVHAARSGAALMSIIDYSSTASQQRWDAVQRCIEGARWSDVSGPSNMVVRMDGADAQWETVRLVLAVMQVSGFRVGKVQYALRPQSANVYLSANGASGTPPQALADRVTAPTLLVSANCDKEEVKWVYSFEGAWTFSSFSGKTWAGQEEMEAEVQPIAGWTPLWRAARQAR